jgi:Arc/MetJ-type ribon-helix-helix transcriptional regulator
MDTEKITFTLPKPLLQRLEQAVPEDQRGRFVIEAIVERLALMEQSTALEETAGLWQDESYHEMKSEQDIDNWLNEMRRGWV